MKKVLALIVVVLGAFMALRYLERRIPSSELPPERPPVAAPEQPVATTPNTQPGGPTLPTTPAAQPPLVQADTGSGIEEVDAVLASVERWKTIPDASLLSAQCSAAPKDKVQPPPKTVSDYADKARQYSITQQEVLCSGDLEGCARFDLLEPPTGEPGAGESKGWTGGRTKLDCILSVVELLYARSVGEGKPSDYYCKAELNYVTGTVLPEDELASMCRKFANDYRTGSDNMCKELSSKPRNGKKFEYENCAGPLYQAKGEQACIDGMGRDNPNIINCMRLARIMKAAKTGDVSKCDETIYLHGKPHFAGGRDPLCRAVMQDPGVCKQQDIEDKQAKEWYAKRCQEWSVAQVAAWISDVDTNGQAALDALPRLKEQLEAGPADKQQKFGPKLAAAQGVLKAALKKKEELRARMNKGQLPGQK